jgi:hypothetical protein
VAYCLYSNGITESYRPKDLTFTEEEIVKLFDEFEEIITERLITVLNAWCIYGYSKNPDPIDFNRIASDLIKAPIYSHVLYVHDSEINPNWKVTDSLLYKNYNDFSYDIRKAIDDIASNIINQFASTEDYEEKVSRLPQLITMGATEDKRILFGFNPTEQDKEFYTNDEFYIFSQRVYDYISHNKQVKEPFTIYADKKAVIIIDVKYVVSFLNTMLEKFKSKEDYEICTDISNMIKTWSPKTKKTRRKKSSDENKL